MGATAVASMLHCPWSGEFIEFMPKPPGTRVVRERAVALLEMSKVIRSVRAPVGGVLLESNPRAVREPTLVNARPYDEGWLVRLQPTDWEGDCRSLVTAGAIRPPSRRTWRSSRTASAFPRHEDASRHPVVGHRPPEAPHRCATPFFHAAAAAALDGEVEVHFSSRSVLLLVEGAAARLHADDRSGKSIYDPMQQASRLGAKFLACSDALEAHAVERMRLIPEVADIAGAAAFLGRALDPEWATLVF